MGWRPISEKPKDRQICAIRGERDMIITNIPYSATGDCWIDIFAERDAGHAYGKDAGIIAWIPDEEIPQLPDWILDNEPEPANPINT